MPGSIQNFLSLHINWLLYDLISLYTVLSNVDLQVSLCPLFQQKYKISLGNTWIMHITIICKNITISFQRTQLQLIIQRYDEAINVYLTACMYKRTYSSVQRHSTIFRLFQWVYYAIQSVHIMWVQRYVSGRYSHHINIIINNCWSFPVNAKTVLYVGQLHVNIQLQKTNLLKNLP